MCRERGRGGQVRCDAEQRGEPPAAAALWRFTWPALLGGVTVPLVGLCDAAIAGHLGEPTALAAAGLAATAFDCLFFAFSFLRMGTTALSAQAFGERDELSLSAALLRPALLALSIGGLIALGSVPLAALALLPFGAESAVCTAAESYLAARLLGAPAALLNFAHFGWLIGAQRPRAVMGAQLLLNTLNITLSLFFSLQLQLGLWGLGAASALSQLIIAIGLGAVLRRRYRARGIWPLMRRRAPWRRLLQISRDLMLRTLALMSVFALFQRTGAGIGTLTLAANSALLQLQQLQSYALDGFAHGAEALIGEAVGARRREQLRSLVGVAARLSALSAAGIALLWLSAGGTLIALLTDLPLVRAEALRFLPWAILSPLISVWPFLLDGILIGAAETRALRQGMLASLGLFIIANAVLVPYAGNHGLWLAFLLFMMARGLTLLPALRRLLRGD